MEEQYTLVTETGINGIRLDKYLSDRLPDAITRSFLQKLIKEEQVTVDGRLQKANYKLKPEQTIQITIPPAEETAILPEDIPLDILYEDNDLLVVNKPKDMVVHPSAGHYTGTLVNAIMFHCKGSLPVSMEKSVPVLYIVLIKIRPVRLSSVKMTKAI